MNIKLKQAQFSSKKQIISCFLDQCNTLTIRGNITLEGNPRYCWTQFPDKELEYYAYSIQTSALFMFKQRWCPCDDCIDCVDVYWPLKNLASVTKKNFFPGNTFSNHWSVKASESINYIVSQFGCKQYVRKWINNQ